MSAPDVTFESKFVNDELVTEELSDWSSIVVGNVCEPESEVATIVVDVEEID